MAFYKVIDRYGNEMAVSDIQGDQYKTTSTTCQDIVSTGNITITVEPGMAYTPLQDIIVYADAANHMHGEVVTYNNVTGELVMNVHHKSGSGNYCNWTVNLDAVKLAAVWTDVTVAPGGTGNIGGPRFEKMTDGSMYYIDPTGRAEKIEDAAIDCTSKMVSETFIATAGQTVFNLQHAPGGDVIFSRDGATLNTAAATVSGSVVTYVPAQNDGFALTADDRIDITYVYQDCAASNGATVAGSTVTGVAPITVTGTGSSLDPYVVAYAGPTTAKRILGSGYVQGGAAVTVASTSPETDINCSVTFTLAAAATLVVHAQVIGASTVTNITSQGVGLLLLDGAIIQSKYYSTPRGNTLDNLPTPAILTAVVNVAAGTHTLKLQADVWANSAIFNFVPTTYAGYKAAYSTCMLSEISYTAHEA